VGGALTSNGVSVKTCGGHRDWAIANDDGPFLGGAKSTSKRERSEVYNRLNRTHKGFSVRSPKKKETVNSRRPVSTGRAFGTRSKQD